MENKIAEALKGEKEILVNSLKGKKVAVIEDDEVQRDIYLQMIKQFIGDSKFSLESLTGYAKYPGRQNGTLYLGTSVGVWGLLDRWDQVPTQMILFNDTKFTPSVDLSKYSTIAIGGIGKMLAEPQTKGGLEEVLRFCARHDFDYTIVGNGSNTIFGDLEGMTIRTNGLDGIYSIGNSTNPQEINQPEKPLELGSDQVRSFLENQEPETELLIEFGAGHKTMPLARQAPNLGIAGVEFLIGIPGTIGGAS
ncbi:MAG: hypothetical protein O2779_05255, partial [Nanoarchaeota archaeon]|nr:hypothetical protein [Nanoarchaeota archaeon]